MSGGMPFDERKFTELILYVGQRPLVAGRVALAVILWRSDFDAYRLHGEAITGQRYLAAAVPGEPRGPRGLLRAALHGWRWGNVQHRLMAGTLRRKDAEWIARQWRDGVPV